MAVLPLQLVNFHRMSSAIGELHAFRQIADVLDSDGLTLASQHVEKMPHSPGTLISIPELVGLTAGSRTHGDNLS